MWPPFAGTVRGRTGQDGTRTLSSWSVYGGDGERNLWGRWNQRKQARPFKSVSPHSPPLKAERSGFVFLRKTDSLTDLNILLDSGSQTAVIILSYGLHKNGNLGFAGHFPSNSNFVLILSILFQLRILKSVLPSFWILLSMVLNVAKCLQLERRAKGSLQTKVIIS